MEQNTHSQEVQCDLLAAAPLQNFAKMPGPTKIVYSTGNEEDDVNTTGADYCIMGADHNTGGADLDTSYQLSQEDTTTE